MKRRMVRSSVFWACAAVMAASGCQGPGGDLAGRAMFAIGQAGAPSAAPIAGEPLSPGAAPVIAPEGAVVAPPRPAGGGSAGGGAAAPVADHALGELTVSIRGLLPPASQRRVLATTADIARVQVIITPTGGQPVKRDVTAAQIAAGVTSVTFTGLPPGPAQVTIYAFDVNNQVIGSSSQTVAVLSGVTTAVALTVTLNPTYTNGPGGLDTTITFEDGPVLSGWPPGTILGIYPTGKQPESIAFDASGNVWVANFGGDSVTKLASDGSALGTFNVRAGTTSNSRPTAIAIHPVTGNAWVVDDLTSRAYVLDPTGVEVASYSAGPIPVAIQFDMLGNAWIADYVAKTVLVVQPTGLPGGAFGVGEYPIDLAFDAMGNAWVVNFKDCTISICSPLTAAVVRTIDLEPGSEPEGIALDALGNAWVPHNRTNKVSKVDPSGSFIQQFDVGTKPRAVAVDQAGNIWVANAGSNDVTRLSPDGLTLGTYNVGRSPRTIEVGPDGMIWVACRDDNNLYKIQP